MNKHWEKVFNIMLTYIVIYGTKFYKSMTACVV